VSSIIASLYFVVVEETEDVCEVHVIVVAVFHDMRNRPGNERFGPIVPKCSF
jgi:hypothetical protein